LAANRCDLLTNLVCLNLSWWAFVFTYKDIAISCFAAHFSLNCIAKVKCYNSIVVAISGREKQKAVGCFAANFGRTLVAVRLVLTNPLRRTFFHVYNQKSVRKAAANICMRVAVGHWKKEAICTLVRHREVCSKTILGRAANFFWLRILAPDVWLNLIRVTLCNRKPNKSVVGLAADLSWG
jgi:hypothetical protein